MYSSNVKRQIDKKNKCEVAKVLQIELSTIITRTIIITYIYYVPYMVLGTLHVFIILILASTL